ncbi:pentatricopeptide repeat domain-containing protein [Spizellomyces punctatus DAOM BR117]|uniref:Pentatricopeptide repeat domain-containing protein n=1 Tax=Spizellomyces punctatus (strain DAOM BR117) TaxID=645134 RepID=A0A0L0HM53_SPIPD|nr:pentatricopeptide repeat domain-containing protein [Spizellomyces punctatus DAOM BR117]KND01899.1 pentatricopeptide repeat domain-containing protein [Spizellomyces punctatus DAOM BR117]|eukprot:XP_016609938.1 pentatricopeptide repeat domain-containing protein [Spizellomyces punctatus DAOM BR117]
MPPRSSPIASTVCIASKLRPRGHRPFVTSSHASVRQQPWTQSSCRRLVKHQSPRQELVITPYNQYTSAVAEAEVNMTALGPWIFGRFYGPAVEQNLGETATAQSVELFASIEYHTDVLLRERAQQRKQEQVTFPDSTFPMHHPGEVTKHEDPWMLYSCLAHDPTLLTHCPSQLFTVILNYTVLAVTSRQTCLDRLYTIIADMGFCRIKPSLKHWTIVLKAYDRWGKLDDVPYMLWEIQRMSQLAAGRGSMENGDTVPFSDAGFYLSLLKHYTKTRHPFAVKWVTRNLLSRCRHTIHTYRHIIDSYVELRDVNSAYRNFARMIREGIIPNRAIYCSMLHGLSLRRCVDVDKKGRNYKHNIRKLSTLTLATRILGAALKQDCDSGLFAATIQVFAKHNYLEGAERILRLMQGSGVKPDKRILLSFFYLNVRTHRVTTAHSLLDILLQDRTMVPDPKDPSLHRFVLLSYIRCGKNAHALRHVWRMDQMGVKLDEEMMKKEGWTGDAWVRTVVKKLLAKRELGHKETTVDMQNLERVEAEVNGRGKSFIAPFYTPFLE